MTSRFLLCATILAAAMLPPAGAQTFNDPSLSVQTFASGLSLPTQIRFLGVNDAFITEKETGRVKRVLNGVTSTVLDLNVSTDSERGLIGLTLDPAFATNNRVYAYYSSTSAASDAGPWLDNRLSSFIWDNSTATLGSETVLQTFGTASDGGQAQGPNHDAGPILFGPDGFLYGTTGDLNRNAAEQNNLASPTTSSLVGGIYRLGISPGPGPITATAAPGNPFLGNANANFHRLYAYGVRNTYGIAFDPLTNRLWDTENGPGTFDEVNIVDSGFNSGWTKIMGPDSRDPQGVGDLVVLPGSAYSDPEFSFLDTNAPTGLAFLANSALDAAYRDTLLVGDANIGNIYRFQLNAARDAFLLSGSLADLVADTQAEANATLFGQGFGSITDMQVGPDGALYVTSIGQGTVYRVVPEPSSALLLVAGGFGIAACRRRAR